MLTDEQLQRATDLKLLIEGNGPVARIHSAHDQSGHIGHLHDAINERAVTSPPMITPEPGRGSDHPALERLP